MASGTTVTLLLFSSYVVNSMNVRRFLGGTCVFTTFLADTPDGERFPQAMNSRFPGFAPISYMVPQNRSKFQLNYQEALRMLVNALKVRRNQPQCSNVALNIRTRQSHCGSCRCTGGRCPGTKGNLSYIFFSEKCTFIIKYSKVWKWCRTFNPKFFY